MEVDLGPGREKSEVIYTLDPLGKLGSVPGLSVHVVVSTHAPAGLLSSHFRTLGMETFEDLCLGGSALCGLLDFWVAKAAIAPM